MVGVEGEVQCLCNVLGEGGRRGPVELFVSNFATAPRVEGSNPSLSLSLFSFFSFFSRKEEL